MGPDKFLDELSRIRILGNALAQIFNDASSSLRITDPESNFAHLELSKAVGSARPELYVLSQGCTIATWLI